MDLSLLRLLAHTFGPAITAASRPGLTFGVIQLVVALLVRTGHATIAPGLAWLISPLAIGFGVLFAVLETLAKHDPDVAALMRDLHIDHALGAFGGFASALLFSALGLPPEAGQPAGGESDLSVAVQLASSGEHAPAVRAAAIGGAVVLNLGLGWVRAKLIDVLDDLSLSALWARLETGGVLALLILLPLLPLVALAFLVIATIALSLLAVGARLTELALDRRSRVPCTACGERVRQEASLCSACRAELRPRVLLDPAGIEKGIVQALGRARAAWRGRRADPAGEAS